MAATFGNVTDAQGSTPRKRKRREAFGTIQAKQLKSGKTHHYPSYLGRDGKRYKSPMAFSTIGDARGWLSGQRAAMEANTWTPETYRQIRGSAVAQRDATTFEQQARKYINTHITSRGEPLAGNTKTSYDLVLRRYTLALNARALIFLDRAAIRQWWSDLANDPELGSKKTARGRAYQFVSAVFHSAVDDGIIPATPVDVKGAASLRTEVDVRTPTNDEVERIFDAMDPRRRALVALAAWMGGRFGEISALTRDDVVLDVVGETERVPRVGVKVTKAQARQFQESGTEIKDPKSRAGKRVVLCPPHITDIVTQHLDEYVDPEPTALLFPATRDRSKPVSYSTIWKAWAGALEASGVPHTNLHALRHFYGTALADSGATPVGIMESMGHTDIKTSLTYIEAVSDRAEQVTANMSATHKDRLDRAARLRAQREMQGPTAAELELQRRREIEAQIAALSAQLTEPGETATRDFPDNVVELRPGA
jgi:integrase